MRQFTQYELEVLGELARSQTHPDVLRSLLERIGNPLGRFLNAGRKSRYHLTRWTAEKTARWIEDGLIRTLHIGRRFADDRTTVSRYSRHGIHVGDLEGVRELPLERLDQIADSLKLGGTVLLGTEGAILGAATSMAYVVPGSQLLVPSLVFADVAGSMTLLSRHTCRLASAYGFSPNQPENMPHLIAAMAPPSKDADEGYIALKSAALKAVYDAQHFMGAGSAHLNRQILERDAPQLIRLITYVARRLGVVISEKNIAVMIPLAGAALNSTVNATFHHVGHCLAKDYFRRMILDERYGTDVVEAALADHRKRSVQPATEALN